MRGGKGPGRPALPSSTSTPGSSSYANPSPPTPAALYASARAAATPSSSAGTPSTGAASGRGWIARTPARCARGGRCGGRWMGREGWCRFFSRIIALPLLAGKKKACCHCNVYTNEINRHSGSYWILPLLFECTLHAYLFHLHFTADVLMCHNL